MNCPCGLEVEYDPDNGYQHLDGSISHDNGKSVTEMMQQLGLPLVPVAAVKAEWEKAHAERGGWLPHEFAGEAGGLVFPRCEVCQGRRLAGEHVAYSEARLGHGVPSTDVEAARKSNPAADAETERIKESAKSATAQGVHKFQAAQWTHPNGHPRCKVCGQEESISPECNREPTQQERDDFQASLTAEFAAAAVHCPDCGTDYFADSDEDITKHKATHKTTDKPEEAEYTGSGCMVALYPSAATLGGIKTSGDLPLEDQQDMHVTLAYMKVTPEGEELEKLKSVVADMARTQGPLTGVWGGTARFNPSGGSDGKPVLVALPDLPELPDFRQNLCDALDAAGFDVSEDHGYVPHLTVAYDDNGQVRAEGEVDFSSVTLTAAGQRFNYMLDGEIEMAAADPQVEMGKLAQGIDAAVDDALTHLRSCADLPPYALQAQAVLQGIEPACDLLLDFFGVSDADDDPQTDSEQSFEVGAINIPTAFQIRDLLARAKEFGEKRDTQIAAVTKANRETERAQIALNKGTAHAQSPHTFMGSLYQAPPACMMCGKKEPDQGLICAGLGGVGQTDGVAPNPLVMASLTDVRDRAFVEAEATELPKERAFLTEVSGRTILTGPASVMGIEKAMTPNEHYLWMQGRFVGAEKANRNGAFWTTADLEVGEPTVRYGPLNWLHEAKHIIGTLADQRLVQPTVEQAADGIQPHIWTLSPIWKWIYPDEAYVVEQASDAGKLWYSMECVSKEVECVGDGGCGAKASYTDYLKASQSSFGSSPAVCSHMRQKSAVRRFAEPTFLGGAVIVPPVRPGWSDADASVLRQAAALSEKAFEQAGRPDMTATEWEYVMADVLRFAEG